MIRPNDEVRYLPGGGQREFIPGIFVMTFEEPTGRKALIKTPHNDYLTVPVGCVANWSQIDESQSSPFNGIPKKDA